MELIGGTQPRARRAPEAPGTRRQSSVAAGSRTAGASWSDWRLTSGVGRLLLVAAACAGCAILLGLRPVVHPPVIQPSLKSVTASVATGGTIHSGRAYAVTAPLDGQIAHVMVRPGQLVREGDLLFVLDPTPLR